MNNIFKGSGGFDISEKELTDGFRVKYTSLKEPGDRYNHDRKTI